MIAATGIGHLFYKIIASLSVSLFQKENTMLTIFMVVCFFINILLHAFINSK